MTPKLFETVATSLNTKHVAKKFRGVTDIDIRDEHGNTPLMVACARAHVSDVVVKYLLDRGAEVNVANNDGDTPLMIACREGNLRVARLLVERGAEVNAENKKGHSALVITCSRTANAELAQYLVECGADINALHRYPHLRLLTTRLSFYQEIDALLEKCGIDLPQTEVFKEYKKKMNDYTNNYRKKWDFDTFVRRFDEERIRLAMQ